MKHHERSTANSSTVSRLTFQRHRNAVLVESYTQNCQLLFHSTSATLSIEAQCV